jgi:hypothetical protein
VTILGQLTLETLTPSRLWAVLDADTRRLAAACLYRPDAEDPGSRALADAAIASTLRFRDAAVRRLPVPKRVDYLTRAVRPDDSLAGALLRALHLGQRNQMLGAFLDRIGIPQREGVIDPDAELEAPDGATLAAAAETLRLGYPADHVELYLASLLALDPVFWKGLADVVRPR